MSFTYAQLKTALQDYTENDETSFVSNLPLFIRQAEERILKNVQLSLFRKNAQAALTQGSPYINLPEDFLAPFSFTIQPPLADGSFSDTTEKTFLDYRDVDFVQAYNPTLTVTGAPKCYAMFDVTNFIVGPTPDTNYFVELHYFYRPDSLTAGADSGTTWLSINAEVALLYGSLVECYTYMKGEADMVQEYQKRFTEALTSLKMFGEAKEVTDEYRTGMVIRAKQ